MSTVDLDGSQAAANVVAETNPTTPMTSRVELHDAAHGLSQRDLALVALFIVIPVVLFTVPAVAGQPLLPGDALRQNYPLRVLAGDLIAHGHFPLWNAWNWSGTPLLGGLNAGALFPGTFLFALLPPLTAWVANEALTYALCGVGLYLLLRAQRLTPVAAALGAASFTFAGFMGAHLRHTGLVQGTALVPWALLAIEGIARSRRVIGRWLLLCVSGGLVILSGEPRAMSSAAIVIAIYLVAVIMVRGSPRARVLFAVGLAVPFVFALGAVQLLPGLDFIHASQRAATGYAFFDRGSLTLPMLPLLAVPYLLGAYGTLDFLPSSVGHYNLHEVVGYIGLLPLVALVTVPFWRARTNAARLWAWLAMVVVGFLLALGGSTPLGHLLADIPLYSGQRLQSRNLEIVDLGLAGTFAWWVDSIIRRPRDRTRAHERRRGELFVGLLPCAIVVALVGATWVAGPALQRWLGITPVHPALFSDLAPYLIGALVVAVAVALFIVVWPRLTPRARAVFLTVIVVADVGIVMVNGELGLTSVERVRRDVAGSDQVSAALAGGGRLGVYDPQHRVTSELDEATTVDLTILHELPSVQGYSSIVDSRYNALTGAHTLRVFYASALAGRVADELDLRILLVPPSYLGDSTASGESGSGSDPSLVAALDPGHWVRAGSYGSYLAFTNAHARGRAWITQRSPTVPGAPAVPAAQVDRSQVGAGDTETDFVANAAPALLVRSVAYADGWSARIHTASGKATTVPAQRFGLVQAVPLPAGAQRVDWSYRPPGFRIGLWLTLLATLALAVIGLFAVVRTVLNHRSEMRN